MKLFVGFISFQLHADTAISGITFHSSKGARSDNGDGSTKSEDVLAPSADPGSLNCS